MKNKVYIGLGSNLGHKQQNLDIALAEIAGFKEIDIIKVSARYLTEPWGNIAQEDFINMVIEIETTLKPLELLQVLQDIEIKMGRQRMEKWGPRKIDLDILLYGDEVLAYPQLIIPHPLMRDRLFVLVPLQELNTELVFPDDGAKIGEVFDRVARERNHRIERI